MEQGPDGRYERCRIRLLLPSDLFIKLSGDAVKWLGRLGTFEYSLS